MTWSNFYAATAGAAATLIGLLFLAVQLNLRTFAANPENHWRAVARSTFSIYTLLFTVPLIFLVPTLDQSTRALVLLIAVTFGIIRAVGTWRPVWRALTRQRSARLWQTLWLLVGPLLAYVILARSAAVLLWINPASDQQEGIAYTLVWLFAIALRNSWNLLGEATYAAKPGGDTSP